MSFRTVELFCDVARCRSFSKAADVNGISQSSVSQAVAQLEKQLGVELVDRRQRPLGLTEAGQRYFDGCHDLMQRFRRLEDSVQQLARRITGRLRVAAIYSVGQLEMDSYVHHLESENNEVELRLDYLHPEEVYERVANETADLGIVSFPRETTEFGAIPWQDQPFVLVTHPQHRLAGRAANEYPAVSVVELKGEPFVGFTPELRVRRQLDRWLRAAKVSPRIVHEFDNVEQIRRAVEDGVGVALLPAATVTRGVEAGTLISLELADVEWYRPLGIIHKRNRTLTSAANRFIELLHEHPGALKSEPASQADSVSVSKQ